MGRAAERLLNRIGHHPVELEEKRDRRETAIKRSLFHRGLERVLEQQIKPVLITGKKTSFHFRVVHGTHNETYLNGAGNTLAIRLGVTRVNSCFRYDGLMSCGYFDQDEWKPEDKMASEIVKNMARGIVKARDGKDECPADEEIEVIYNELFEHYHPFLVEEIRKQFKKCGL